MCGYPHSVYGAASAVAPLGGHSRYDARWIAFHLHHTGDGLYLNGGWCYQGFKATPASGLTFAHTIAMNEAHELNKGYELDRLMNGAALDEHGTGLRDYRQ